jgi:hypothetical protein
MLAPEHADEFRRCLVELDVGGMRAIWRHVAPHLSAGNDSEVLAAMHLARTSAATVPSNLRCYSHAWLIDHSFPSNLPDNLKAKADRLYPRVVEGVGISVNFSADAFKPAAPIIARVMSDAAHDIYADNSHPDAGLVRVRLAEVRKIETVKLFGRFGVPS